MVDSAEQSSIVAKMVEGEECVAGTLYEQQTQQYLEFAYKYFAEFGSFGQTVLMVWGGVWIAWMFFTASYATDKFNKDIMVAQFLNIICVNLIYQGWPFIWELVFLLINTGFWSMGLAISIAAGQSVQADIPTVVYAVSGSIWAGFADTIEALPWLEILSVETPFYALIMFVTFAMMWLRFFGAYISPLARVFGVLWTLGLTAMLVLFHPFRSVPLNNLKILITCVLELALVGAIIGSSLTLIDSIMANLPIQDGNLLIIDFWGSSEYWLIVITNLFIWLTFKEILGVIQTQIDVVLTRGSGLIRGFI